MIDKKKRTITGVVIILHYIITDLKGNENEFKR